MIILSILIALVLERVTPQLVDFRQFKWLAEYSRWMVEVLHVERFGGWMGLAVIVFPVMLVVWIISGMFENALFGIFDLAFGVAVVFFCLGPKDLDSQVDNYLDAIDIGDEQQRFDAASALTMGMPSNLLQEQVVQVCRAVYSEANSRLFTVLFWFALLGPVAVVVYRVLERLLRGGYLDTALHSMKANISLVLGWLDWVPARISLFAYLVSGNFEEGLQRFRSADGIAIEMYEHNNELLQIVGAASIAAHKVSSDPEAMALVRKSRGLILRSLVVWLLLILLFGLFV